MAFDLTAASPWGALAKGVTDIASTPNTSAATAGDFSAGSSTFGIGIQTGGSSGGIPNWLLIAGAIAAVAYFLWRK